MTQAFFARAGVGAFVLALLPRMAAAQEPPDSASLEIVVVTAQKREENQQDVPIAMSALSADSLAVRNVNTVDQLVGVVPSLAISGNTGVNASNLFSIRGVSGQPLPIGASQAVALYLDGVYLSRPEAAIFTMADVERVEVLRGPQGTLYGRNSTAGAVHVITRDPRDAVFASADLNGGNEDTYEFRAAVGGPIGGGFSASASVGGSGHGPWLTNVYTGREVGKSDSLTARVKLGFDSEAQRFRARLSGDHSQTDVDAYFTDVLGGPTHTDYIGIPHPDQVTADSDPAQSERRSHGVALTLDFEINDAWSLAAVTGARRVIARNQFDGDAGSFTTNRTQSENESETLSQELRALYTGERLHLTLGANYYREEGTFGFRALTPATPTPVFYPYGATPFIPYDTTEINSYAAFAQAEYDLLSRLTLVIAGRFNSEDRDFTVDYTNVPGGTRREASLSESDFLPQLGLNYRASDDVLLYAKVSEGYQTPGFNFAPGLNQPLEPFNSEHVLAYEIGAKTDWFDGRLRFNAAAYYYDYEDLQVRSLVATGITTISNAQATLRGLETELSVQLFSGLNLDAHLTYSRGRFGEFCQSISGGTPQAGDPLCAPGSANRSGNQLILAPEWQGGVTLRYERDVSAKARLRASASYAYDSGYPFQTSVESATVIPSWDRIDARIGLELGRFELYAFARNLADDRHPTSAFRLAPTISFVQINDPRTYGLGLKYTY